MEVLPLLLKQIKIFTKDFKYLNFRLLDDIMKIILTVYAMSAPVDCDFRSLSLFSRPEDQIMLVTMITRMFRWSEEAAIDNDMLAELRRILNNQRRKLKERFYNPSRMRLLRSMAEREFSEFWKFADRRQEAFRISLMMMETEMYI